MTAAAALQAEVGSPDARVGNNFPNTDSRAVSRIRTELLTTFVEQMNLARIPYCLLSGFQDYPEVMASDVDFMIRPDDAERIAPLVAEVARRCGAQLVQAIRHETGARYFVLAKQSGRVVAYLHPDCSADYRRRGRLWLAAEQVIENRQRYKSFFVPAIADEFAYYLTKKILKQTIASEQLQRLGALFVSRPDECRTRMRRFWPERTVAAIEQALSRQAVWWMQFHLPALLSELCASVPIESAGQRMMQQVREWQRRLERLMNPTGLIIAVRGGSEQQREQLASALEHNLRPAFRRTLIVPGTDFGGSLSQAVSIWMARVRSTLVIRTTEDAEAGWLVRDEICYVFAEGAVHRDITNRLVYLDEMGPMQQHVEFATRVSLEWLAARLRKRMKFASPADEAFAKAGNAKGES
jgi:hypothetical protein